VHPRDLGPLVVLEIQRDLEHLARPVFLEHLYFL
jgi:hypothetical protein